MITVTDLVKTYGRFAAVDGITFAVAGGEALALWGANGAGKTTAIRCVLGLHGFRGRIEVAGLDIRRHGKAARRAIGYVPQELALYDDFRLTEALHFFARLKRAERRRIPVVLAEVGLEEHRRKRIRELSGGMKQRMALAVALLADPPVLVLDELTSNLDAGAQSGFMALLKRQTTRGKTILFTSHHLDEVEMLADRVLVMEAGRVKAECRGADLAETVRARCVLKLFMDSSRFDDALAALRADGFEAMRNGRGLHVEVAPGAKALPLQTLTRANITVDDFDLTEVETIDTRLGGLDDA